jgi:xanthine dehydrogenase iron-sulfur cluster and FAD-binding subunit A
VKPASFELHRPESVDEAVALLRNHADDAKVLAGGQSLVPMLALRLTRFAHLIDVERIAALHGISVFDQHLRIGAMTPQQRLIDEPLVGRHVPLLARAAPHIGHFQIRNRGTVGGSLAHADPASELPAVALALDAVFETDRREIVAADFFVDTWTTALADDELLVAVRFPVWPGDVRAAVYEVARRSGDFALAGAAVQASFVDDRVERFAHALFGIGPIPHRSVEAEAALRAIGTIEASEALDDACARATRDLDPNDDIHATSGQRRHLAGVALRRAIDQLADTTERAGSGTIGSTRAAPQFTPRAAKWSGSVGDVDLVVNGERRRGRTDARTTLADFIRDELGLTGTHVGCEHGVCGSCTVLLDGQAIRSCLVFAPQTDGREVTTIEGIGPEPGGLGPVQQAFMECHGLQCGFCTPGFITSITAYLDEHPNPADDEIITALSGNLCRCTGYQGIVAAMHRAIELRAEDRRAAATTSVTEAQGAP